MSDDEAEVRNQVKLVKMLIPTRKGVQFTNLLRAKCLNINSATDFAVTYYRLLKRYLGFREPIDQVLNYVGISQFTYMLLSVVLGNHKVTMINASDCKIALATFLLDFEKYDDAVQNRMAKCLLEATNQIKNHS
jgi:hypothetical protein